MPSPQPHRISLRGSCHLIHGLFRVNHALWFMPRGHECFHNSVCSYGCPEGTVRRRTLRRTPFRRRNHIYRALPRFLSPPYRR
ncbi:hypothetical protein PC129_g20889 [Phytophthora cactorum]|uniref:Uncharacterized protein n=1 Tax=Phytophthora cactorum TaxID=29920 RepID=A0A329RGD2_9STRA|nr:hypothetical protein Pcac1_g5276 [Phytophthora cactorum]KAG2797698.1 hypothetical protein PC111_g21179 [Phytophthora cactorum]KAG2797802.1 hypothetical protein PC112_g21623 [Phytophthora cactorum]KAG2827860.1 hypothetical protein PC113_g21549 [Phytophthora cactorum]KAG2876923.1 hypothetical protein PC114_g23926 [Phytophthora cactorum]